MAFKCGTYDGDTSSSTRSALVFVIRTYFDHLYRKKSKNKYKKVSKLVNIS